MKRILSLLLCLIASLAQGANWYVRPSFSGTHTGVDWNTAWNDVSGINWGSVSAGDTIWLAGGTYTTQLSWGAGGTSINNPVTVMRVRSTNSVPIAAAGWSAAFDSQVQISQTILLNGYNYIWLNGQIDQGIFCDMTSSQDGLHFATSGRSTVVGQKVSYVAFLNNNPNQTLGYGMRDSVGPAYTANGTTIAHCYFNGVIVPIDVNNATAWTVEYNTFLNCTNAGAGNNQHCDYLYVWNCAGLVIRYNQFNTEYSQAITFYGHGGPYTGIYFYGNVCDSGTALQSSGYPQPGTALGGIFIAYYAANGSGNWGPLEVYNNTFVGWPDSIATGPDAGFVGSYSGTYHFYNNIFWNTFPNLFVQPNTSIVHANNAYNTGVPSGEVNGVALSSSPFVGGTPPGGVAGGSAFGFNYQIKSGSQVQNTGITLTNDGFVNKDLLGNTRGSSGAWSIGAYEFGNGSPATNPITQLSTSTLTFPGVALTNTSTTQTFSILNGGTGTLTGYVSGATAPFSFVGSTNYALNGGVSSTITVKFNPTGSNTFSGTLNFTDNGGGSSSTVSLSGQANILLASPFSALSGTLNGWSVSNNVIWQPTDVSGSPIGTPGMSTAYYWFSVPTSTNYTITAPVLALGTAQNSFWVNVDNVPVDPAYVWDIFPPQAATTNTAISLRGNGSETTDQFQPNTWFLTAGVHQLILYGRESFVQVSQFTINGPSSGNPPVISGPTATTNDAFRGFSMSVSATGTTPLFFQWYSNTTLLNGKTNSLYSQIPAGIGTNTFSCVVSNAFGLATNSATAAITNGTIPFFAAQPVSASNSTNGGVQVFCQVIGTPAVFLQWRTNGVAIPGATNANYSLVPVVPAQTNSYTCLATNNYGSTTSATAVMANTNGVTAAIITNQPQAVTNLRITGFTLSVGADGTPPLTYQWEKNSNAIPFFGSTMSIVSATTNDSGWYSCAVSNAFGGAVSQNVFVSMTNGLLPVVVGPTNWTAGTNVGIQLYSVVTAGDYVGIGLPTFFQWVVLGTNITGQNSSNLTLVNVPAQTNNYSVIAQNFEGSTTNSALVTITNSTQNLPPTIVSQPVGTTNVKNSCVSMSVGASGNSPFSYQWRLNGVQYNQFTNSTIPFCPAHPIFSGPWTVVIVNGSGSVTSAVAQVLITNAIAPPIAVSSCSASGQNFVYALLPVAFSSAGSYSPSGLPLTYFWNFGDGTTSTLANPVHSFTGGFRSIRMSVSDGVNAPVFATDINLLVMPFQISSSGYYKKLMF